MANDTDNYIQFTNITDGEITGDGYFDRLMGSARKHIEEAIDLNHITQGQAGEVYVSVIPAMISEAIKFELAETLTEQQVLKVKEELNILTTEALIKTEDLLALKYKNIPLALDNDMYDMYDDGGSRVLSPDTDSTSRRVEYQEAREAEVNSLKSKSIQEIEDYSTSSLIKSQELITKQHENGLGGYAYLNERTYFDRKGNVKISAPISGIYPVWDSVEEEFTGEDSAWNPTLSETILFHVYQSGAGDWTVSDSATATEFQTTQLHYTITKENAATVETNIPVTWARNRDLLGGMHILNLKNGGKILAKTTAPTVLFRYPEDLDITNTAGTLESEDTKNLWDHLTDGTISFSDLKGQINTSNIHTDYISSLDDVLLNSAVNVDSGNSANRTIIVASTAGGSIASGFDHTTGRPVGETVFTYDVSENTSMPKLKKALKLDSGNKNAVSLTELKKLELAKKEELLQAQIEGFKEEIKMRYSDKLIDMAQVLYSSAPTNDLSPYKSGQFGIAQVGLLAKNMYSKAISI